MPAPPTTTVIAVAAIDAVVPASPDRTSSPPLPMIRSAPSLAADDVAGGVAGQGVGVAGAVQVLDVGQRVAQGVAAEVRLVVRSTETPTVDPW